MNISLLAMSGIRVCDQELLSLGLTLPGFVDRSKVIASLPSLGLLTLAGMTPGHHRVKYVEIADIPDESSVRTAFSGSDIVAISTYSAQVKESYRIADIIRSMRIPVVMGGLHVTALPAEAAAHCDAVVTGEGECSWPQLLKDAERNRLKRVYGSPETEFNMNEAPMPAFELLDIAKYNRLTVQTGRGCSHRCEFCASSILLTGTFKQKPQPKVLAEIDKIREIWDHPFIEFADDNTFVNKAYWKQILPEIRKRRIRWFTETDLSIANDPELLGLMKDSGCAQVLIGFESPNASGLNGLENIQNWKLKQLPFYRESVRAIQSCGISVNGCFILGLDGQGPDIFGSIFDFVEETGLHEVQITLQTAFPGTPLYGRLKKTGRLLNEEAWETCTLFDINFIPQNMTADELRNGFRDLGIRLYSDEFTTRRRNRFREQLREVNRHDRNGI